MKQFRISESYFLPFQQVSQWYVEGLGSDQHAGGRSRARCTRTRRDDWHDGDMLIVPLSGAGGNLLGLMSLDRPFDDHRPDRNTIEILEIFAHQAATTLENTRLYMTTVRNAEQEARLNEVMEAIASTLDMTEIVEAVARGALRLLPFMRMTFALLETRAAGLRHGDGDGQSGQLAGDSARSPRHARSYGAWRTFENGQDYLYGVDDADDYEDLNVLARARRTHIADRPADHGRHLPRRDAPRQRPDAGVRLRGISPADQAYRQPVGGRHPERAPVQSGGQPALVQRVDGGIDPAGHRRAE